VKKAILGSFLFVIICSAVPALAAEGFTQKDREMLIELKVRMGEIDKRFEQVDKRFSGLREDMNKRFEQVDKRFEEILTFLAILAGVFGSMVVAVFGFAYWDRRAILTKAREEVREMTKADRNLIEKNSLLLTKLTEAMRRMADKSPDIREALQHSNLL
jgi:nitrate reductase NapE component